MSTIIRKIIDKYNQLHIIWRVLLWVFLIILVAILVFAFSISGIFLLILGIRKYNQTKEFNKIKDVEILLRDLPIKKENIIPISNETLLDIAKKIENSKINFPDMFNNIKNLINNDSNIFKNSYDLYDKDGKELIIENNQYILKIHSNIHVLDIYLGIYLDEKLYNMVDIINSIKDWKILKKSMEENQTILTYHNSYDILWSIKNIIYLITAYTKYIVDIMIRYKKYMLDVSILSLGTFKKLEVDKSITNIENIFKLDLKDIDYESKINDLLKLQIDMTIPNMIKDNLPNLVKLYKDIFDFYNNDFEIKYKLIKDIDEIDNTSIQRFEYTIPVPNINFENNEIIKYNKDKMKMENIIFDNQIIDNKYQKFIFLYNRYKYMFDHLRTNTIRLPSRFTNYVIKQDDTILYSKFKEIFDKYYSTLNMNKHKRSNFPSIENTKKFIDNIEMIRSNYPYEIRVLDNIDNINIEGMKASDIQLL